MAVTWTQNVRYVLWAGGEPSKTDVVSSLAGVAIVTFDSGFAHIIPTNGGGSYMRAKQGEYIVYVPKLQVLTAAGMRDQYPGII
jgi:hypothetical protein